MATSRHAFLGDLDSRNNNMIHIEYNMQVDSYYLSSITQWKIKPISLLWIHVYMTPLVCKTLLFIPADIWFTDIFALSFRDLQCWFYRVYMYPRSVKPIYSLHIAIDYDVMSWIVCCIIKLSPFRRKPIVSQYGDCWWSGVWLTGSEAIKSMA